ncbi:aspartate aminotransferase family protein [Silvibacterium dinghuense]|uniref:Acetylornithine aminotransferase n=1 Tax=Silvibacterium dinghuense TaxID=1560006 RepID=A0A4Q1SGJ2_9BACT|nr:aspartate aminotransferase family protein [Silvibacterium dinghuense]RXS96443.1 aspartate aminotransferase family protein [Silvibacterium dinghuense]GGG90801.1 aspartate aminotransferase family protein [Silvibacterium dinghuense]
MTLEEIQAAEAKLLLSTYERNPIHFVSGEGVYLVDEKGNRYLDLLSGIGVNALGYGHTTIEKAILEQSRKLIHTSNLFFHEGQAELALRLTQASGLDRAFFSNSGTEAMEAALKLARAHAGLLRSEGRTIGTKFLALEHSFHGRTMGAVATTHKAKYREPFAPVMGDVEFVAFNSVSDLNEKFSTDVCAIVLEVIQGEGGIRMVSREFFEVARALTQSTGALLIVDEIQAGFGRTGKWFAYQNYDVLPDVTTVAKPLAGGLPLGAMLCTEEAARAIHPGMHGTTFGGGPLACAVAIAVFDEMEKTRLLEHVTEVGTYFTRRLHELQAKHPAIVEVRGKGLMLAAELDSAELAKDVLNAMLERRILINRTSETVLRFLPPYILKREHVDAAADALDEILTERAPQTAGAANEGGTNIG